MIEMPPGRPARHRRRRASLAAIGVYAVALGATVAFPPTPRLLWNATASAPIGLYWIVPEAAVPRGELVAARLPEPVRALAAWRDYLPSHVPVMKRVAAREGDTVCAFGEIVFINGQRVARRYRADGKGRPLPWWMGCRTLAPGELFLLMSAHPASFDGRYFGVTETHDVIGKAVPLWTR
jgi:conjugative transfer signal peptidase TraF